ncbi:hypothetical protein [Propionicimonas sp.]|uniref:hypothetical protein n=1 Tax=Propionicimonas sp. TaxID=1955623 RepID=UPI0017F7D6BF|nr:hypothetical protein [Propionicimonas sp.]MBU3976503.1 hypothetical protein [Actinomycetota bacterium]MBA3020343.1 hypothetical protein [Propionicimonas sp.]MBU3987335.1 hypothetical protein [Actinomycetota bacterium]MBU4007647.1 hypothetical protein [Actinomycetota bacterium]MBU4064428.1 hypothetical protein [Actinomycetota bacterium]
MQLRKPLLTLAGATLALGLSACVVPPVTTAPTPSPQPTTVASSPSVTPSASQSASLEANLGPDGVAALKLGMTKAQAIQTGQATEISGSAGTCGADGDGRLLGAHPADVDDLDGKLFFSATTGQLVIIGATSSIATPEGVHLGSTYAQVKKAYPTWKGSEGKEGVGFVKVTGNAEAFYRIYLDAGQVLELTLQAKDQDCAE